MVGAQGLGDSSPTIQRPEALKILGASANATNGDILFYLADSIAITVQYGNRTGLCKLLEEL